MSNLHIQYSQAIEEAHHKFMGAIKEILERKKKTYSPADQHEISFIFENINTKINEAGFWIRNLHEFLSEKK